MDLSPGCWLGDWMLEASLGAGGFGRVYRARHAVTGVVAAVKVARERRDLRPVTLEHPNVVRTLEERLDHEPPFVALELVPDGSLREALRAGPLAPARALEVVTQVAAALDHAHSRGLLHLDVKPENVLVDAAAGRYKLADFGAPAAAASAQTLAHSLPLTGDLRLTGTRDYAAPELREGASRLDRRADVYSLGVLAYELLTGRLPLGLDRPSELAPALPRAVDAALEHALARGPERRTLSAGAFARELAAAMAPPPRTGAEVPTRQRRRTSWLPAALLAAVAALVGGVLFQRLRPSEWSLAPRGPTAVEARLRPLLAELPAGARAAALPPLDLAARGDTPRARALRGALEDAVARAGRAPASRLPITLDAAGLFVRATREELSRVAGCEAALHAVMAASAGDEVGRAHLTLIDLASWSVVAATPPRDPDVLRLGRRAAGVLLARGDLRPVAVLPVVDAARGVSNRATAALDAELLAALVLAGEGRLAVRARPGMVERLRDSRGEVRRALSVGLALQGQLDAASGRLTAVLRDLETGAVIWTEGVDLAGFGDYDVGLDMDRFTADATAVDRLLAESLDRLFDAEVAAQVERGLTAAQASLDEGHPEAAVAALQALRARGRGYAGRLEPLLLLARAHHARDELALAQAALEEAVTAAPDDPRARDELARTALARAARLFRAGKRPWWRDDDEARFEEALDLLRRLDGLELSPGRRGEVRALRERLEDEL